MQISAIPPKSPNKDLPTSLMVLNAPETTLFKHLLQSTQRSRSIHQNNSAKEWLYVIFKVSLAMNSYFAECPDEQLQARYACCMEAFSDFVDFAGDIDSSTLDSLCNKASAGD